MIMPSDECHMTLLMISQHWFRWWLGAIRQQATIWANVDSVPCRLMVSLGHNELTHWGLVCRYVSVNTLIIASGNHLAHVRMQYIELLMCWIKSLQLIWRSGTRRFDLRVPDLQTSCSDLIRMRGNWNRSPNNDHQVIYPIITGGTLVGSQLALERGLACSTGGGTHHAFPDYGAGFCLINDLAISAKYLRHKKLAEKILIVDLDVHQVWELFLFVQNYRQVSNIRRTLVGN